MNSSFVLSQTDGRPMYLQIMEQIKQRVALGDWPAGEKIPSIRELSIELRVSVITVKRAYLELEREGVIVTRHGKGSWVAEAPGLSNSLGKERLEQHLRKALEMARLLGLDRAQIGKMLEQIEGDEP